MMTTSPTKTIVFFVPITLLTLLTGAVIGFLNGLLITKRYVPPFIATLGMAIILNGLRLMWTKGLPRGRIPQNLVEIGTGEDMRERIYRKTALGSESAISSISYRKVFYRCSHTVV